jgi:hypothetical protein
MRCAQLCDLRNSAFAVLHKKARSWPPESHPGLGGYHDGMAGGLADSCGRANRGREDEASRERPTGARMSALS